MKDLRITGLDVYLCETRDNVIADSTRVLPSLGFTVVVLKTNSDIEGIGFTYNDLCGHSFGVYVKDVLEPLLIGEDPLGHEDLYDSLIQQTHSVGRRGFALYTLGAIDTALWDIKGKATGLPVYKLLGGNKTKIPVYASGGWISYTKDQLLDEVTHSVESGYKAVKIKVGIQGGTNIDEDIRRISAVRKAIGDDIMLMVDANQVWKSAEAILFAKKAEEYNIRWLEEPVQADDMEGMARIRCATTIPIATGENEYTRYGVRDLVMAKALDILQSEVGRCGGITELLKMNAIAQAWNLQFAPHCTDFVHMHMVSAAPNGLILERLLGFENVINNMFLNPPIIKDSMMEIPDLPGLGLKLDMNYVSRIKVE